MRFYVLLALVNVGCFLPLYALGFRVSPNPFGFLKIADRSRRTWPIKVLYLRFRSTDPFRIHFDYTFFALVAVAAQTTGPAARAFASVLLVLGFIELQYTVLMHSVFKRPPALASDLALLRAGVSLARRQMYWLVPAAVGALALLVYVALAATAALFDAAPEPRWPALALALVLVPLGVYHAETTYIEFISRTVYSPVLHLALNLRHDAMVKGLYSREAAHYEQYNVFRGLHLEAAPNIVIGCVESYGSIAFRDGRCGAGIPELIDVHEADLSERGYHFASTFSDPPLFAGGSWMSYATFAYGALINDMRLYDGLFARPSNFEAYESLFHVLRRNGYENVLLCPLGGVDARTVEWEAVDRCFQPHRRIAFDDLDYVGPEVNFLGLVRLHAPLDQFSLNFAYESAREGGSPFSLFFCTLNSHYPWHTAAEAADDWRALNTPASTSTWRPSQPKEERYNAAIRYQIDYLLRFARDRAEDAPLIILFGDHQPPFITPDEMGRQTPVHVISKDRALIDVLLAHGFAGTLNLAGLEPRTVRHEGLLSLLMKALHAAYGTEPEREVDYLEGGSDVFRTQVARP